MFVRLTSLHVAKVWNTLPPFSGLVLPAFHAGVELCRTGTNTSSTQAAAQVSILGCSGMGSRTLLGSPRFQPEAHCLGEGGRRVPVGKELPLELARVVRAPCLERVGSCARTSWGESLGAVDAKCAMELTRLLNHGPGGISRGHRDVRGTEHTL
jgi:hypothetical protein